ncbi:hypothetical protein V6N13_029541 [Hibiscus sabdariffa]|uniref:Uncharacterized protein n=1 Tax=Hibiscus sabdariffa TaxID=183260 RepID=A0ABR2T9N8_9ROSI
MSGAFVDGVNIPRSFRKHRRLDDDPPDGGGFANTAARSTGVVPDQDRIAPKAASNKESLLHNSMEIPSKSDEFMDEEDIIIEEGEIIRKEIDDKCPKIQQPSAAEANVNQTVTNQQQAEESSFGPWMVVECRQRKPLNMQDTSGKSASGMIFQGSRFNPLQDRANAANDAQSLPNAPLADVPIQQVRSAASIRRIKPRNKGKLITTLKPAKSITLRKPHVVNLAEFPALIRNQSKASNSSHPLLTS